MANYTEILKLDADILENLTEVYFGYASYLREQDNLKGRENRTYHPFVASSFLISAIFQTLTDPQKAKHTFGRAARAYRDENNPFWKIVAVCANDKKLLNGDLNPDGFIQADAPDKQFSEMIASQFINTKNGKVDFSFNQSAFLDYPIGRIGIPMNVYIRAFAEINEFNGGPDNYIRRLTSLTMLLNRAAEGIKFLQSDTYHWRNLKGTFIPLEPEILAACINVCQLLRYKQIDINVLVQGLDIDDIAGIPLMIAWDINQSESNDFVLR